MSPVAKRTCRATSGLTTNFTVDRIERRRDEVGSHVLLAQHPVRIVGSALRDFDHARVDVECLDLEVESRVPQPQQ